MKKNVVAMTLLLITAALLIGSCEGPAGPMGPAGQNGTNGQDGAKGDTGQDGANGQDSIVIQVTVPSGSAGNMAAAISAAIETLIEDNSLSEADKDDPAKAITLVVSELQFSRDLDMYYLYDAIDSAGYYVNLDLSGAVGSTFKYIALAKDISKAKILSLTLGSGVTTPIPDITYTDRAADNPFAGFTAIKRITAPGITRVGNSAFYQYTSLEEANFPAATSIGGSAFEGCTTLETVSLPAATSIVGNAFKGCTTLETVSLPAATSIGGYAFEGCTTLETVNLPAATYIDRYAFDGCTNLETVSLPAVTSIYNGAFYGCTNLKTVSLPAVTSIYDDAFYGCTNLETVSLPAVTSIYDDAFYGCAKLMTVTLGETAPTLGYSILSWSIPYPPQTVTVKVPSGASGYGGVGTYYEQSAYTVNWANGFRGNGWDGSAFTEDNRITYRIKLVIETLP